MPTQEEMGRVKLVIEAPVLAKLAEKSMKYKHMNLSGLVVTCIEVCLKTFHDVATPADDEWEVNGKKVSKYPRKEPKKMHVYFGDRKKVLTSLRAVAKKKRITASELARIACSAVGPELARKLTKKLVTSDNPVVTLNGIEVNVG